MVDFLREKLEQDRKFKSEDSQGENSKREAHERQPNQLITQNEQMQAQQSQTIEVLLL